jgi:segregation and condensation protein B
MTTETLTEQQIAQIIEGLLFVASEPATITSLASVMDCSPDQVELGLKYLQEQGQQRGIHLQRQGEKLQLVTAPELTGYIERFLGLTASTRLSTPALETLGIIVYRQPITRPEIEAIRGVNSDGVLRTLLSKGLIEEVGRLDTVGHPSLFGVTFEFLRYFGLKDIKDLPELELPRNGAEQIVDETENEVK